MFCCIAVTLQLHGVQMSLLCHDRKDLFLYRCWSQLHTHKHICTEDYTSICKCDYKELGILKIPSALSSATREKKMKQRERESHLDPVEHAGVEDVHPSIDLVGYKDLRFLYKAIYPTTFCTEHYNAVFRGLLHPCYLQTHSSV